MVHNYNLGQNKMEQQTPIPPKSRMKPREGQNRAIFPSLIWGDGGLLFHFFVQDCSLYQLDKKSGILANLSTTQISCPSDNRDFSIG